MKVLKIAAIVVGVVALAATGIGFALGAGSLTAAFSAGLGAIGLGSLVGAVGLGTLGTIALGAIAIDLSMVAGALAPKPSLGGQQTKWKADPYAGIPYAMGRTLVGGNIVYRRGHGPNNKYNTFVTVLSLGAIASIDATFMDKAAASFSGTAATGSYAGQIWQTTQLGATPESAALTPPVDSPPGWTSAHKLSGLAAVMNTFAYDAQNKNGLTTIPAPSWIGHWVKVYDPRLDSTYPGGSGSCRAYNEATYVWSENPHLHALTWAMGRYQNGVRVAGIGPGNSTPAGTVKGVEIAPFVEGANLDDARGWKLGGQVYTRPDTLWNSLKAMLQAGGARPVMIGGQISCVNQAPRVSLATITRDDIIGQTSFAGTQPRRGRINGIIPQYRSEAHDWETVSAARVGVPAFLALDGDERTREIAYPLVQQVNQASQLAIYDIYNLREAGPGTVPLKPAWLNYRVGDCVTFAPEDGVALKTIITGRGFDAQTASVTYTLKGETDGKHAFALGTSGTAPPLARLDYVDDVAAPPAGDWAIAATALSANGTQVPALVVSGACTNSSVDAVVVEYRRHVAGQATDAGWLGAAIEAPSFTKREITSVTTLTDYDVSIRYRLRAKLGPRLILGPVTTADFESPGSVGAPGLNSYVHFAYADSADGTVNFTTGSPGGRAYVGVYSDNTPADSTSPGAYDWSRYAGPATFGLYPAANVIVGPDFIQKTAPTTAYDASAYSTEAFVGGCAVSFVPPRTNLDYMVGLNSDPASNDSYETIDYALNVDGGSGLSKYESGARTILGTYAAGDVLQVHYDGKVVRYLKNGVLLDTTVTGVPQGARFFLDTSIYHAGARIEKIRWNAAGQAGTNGINGLTPVVAAATPSSKSFSANYDGSLKPGQLPLGIAISATKAGSAIGGTITISATSGCTASVVTGGIQIDSVFADTGWVRWTLTASDGQVVSDTWTFGRVRDPASGGTISKNFSDDSWTATGSYPATGFSAALTATPDGRLSISAYGEFTKSGGAGSATIAAKLQYRLVGGSYADSGYSGSGTANNYSEPGSPLEIVPGYLSFGGTLTGLVGGGSYEVQLVGSKSGGAVASCAGYITPGQPA